MSSARCGISASFKACLVRTLPSLFQGRLDKLRCLGVTDTDVKAPAIVTSNWWCVLIAFAAGTTFFILYDQTEKVKAVSVEMLCMQPTASGPFECSVARRKRGPSSTCLCWSQVLRKDGALSDSKPLAVLTTQQPGVNGSNLRARLLAD